MKKNDEALSWLEQYFQQRGQYNITVRRYGENIPSNGITVQGSPWFTLNYCISWPAPQVTCSMTPTNMRILMDIHQNILTREEK